MELRPAESREFKRGEGAVLLIACGALAREIVGLIEANGWRHIDVQCLPAKLHNTPEAIPEAVREKIRAARAKGGYERILVAYGDCGSGGRLDAVLAAEGVERIAGPHCYAFYSGNKAFAARADAQDMRAFYLTDYLVRHFEKLVWQGLGLDRNPDMLAFVFGHYEKLVYLAQTKDAALEAKARAAAERLGLAYEYRYTGLGELASFLEGAAAGR